jgi:hypothetical protein
VTSEAKVVTDDAESPPGHVEEIFSKEDEAARRIRLEIEAAADARGLEEEERAKAIDMERMLRMQADEEEKQRRRFAEREFLEMEEEPFSPRADLVSASISLVCAPEQSSIIAEELTGKADVDITVRFSFLEGFEPLVSKPAKSKLGKKPCSLLPRSVCITFPVCQVASPSLVFCGFREKKWYSKTRHVRP